MPVSSQRGEAVSSSRRGTGRQLGAQSEKLQQHADEPGVEAAIVT